MTTLAFLMLGLLPFAASANFKIGEQVLSRWTNNLYYRGHVLSLPSTTEIEVQFTDGDRITHPVEDSTAVIADRPPRWVEVRQHVLATWSGGNKDKYFLGFIIDKTSSEYKVLFDDGDQAWYKRQDLRVLPVVRDKFQVGARVFALWPDNGYYYRGFVVDTYYITVKVHFDDEDDRWFKKVDIHGNLNVVLDEIPDIPAQRYLRANCILAAT